MFIPIRDQLLLTTLRGLGRHNRFAVFSDRSITILQTDYPGLVRTSPGTIEGILYVDAVYRGHRLAGSFRVRISAPKPEEHLPSVFEIGERIKAIAEKWNIADPRDLHCNGFDNGLICLCVKQVEKVKCPLGTELWEFIKILVVPYFFGLLWFEIHKKWPWGEYSHGGVGLLEYYADAAVPYPTLDEADSVIKNLRVEKNWKKYLKQLKKPSAKRECPCGQQTSFNKCHPQAFAGLRRFHAGLIRLNFILDPARLR